MIVRRNTSTLMAVALTASVALAGCSDDPTGPEGSATVSAYMTDDSSSPLFTSPAYVDGAGSPGPASSVNGSLSGNAQVYLYSEAHGWVAAGSPRSATVALRSSSETAVASEASIPAGTYTKVRLVLDGFSAHLNAGSVLGDLTLGTAVNITVGGSDGYVEVEKSVNAFTVQADANATIRFDMNSEAWVDAQSAQSETTTDAEIRSATSAQAVVQ